MAVAATHVTISSTALPSVAFEGNLQETLDLYASCMIGTFTGAVIEGQAGGSAPTSNVGQYFPSNGLRYVWNSTESKYLPAPVAIGRIFTGSTILLTAFVSTATTNRTLYTPDKDGTLALTTDVYGKVNTGTLSGATPSINCNDEIKHYYLVLSANALVSLANMVDGQERHIWVEQPPSGTWTFGITGVAYPTGFPDAWSALDASNRKINHFKLWKVGEAVFAEQIGEFLIPASGGGSDTTAPTLSTIGRTSTGIITVTFSELLQANSNVIADFVVKYTPAGGSQVTKTISSAVVSGTNAVLTISSGTNTSTTAVTVQYTGTSIKDLAGNSAATFAATSATYTTNNTGGSGGGGGGGGGGQNIP